MDDVQFIKDNTIIGKIEGRNATISEMQDYFNRNTLTKDEYYAYVRAEDENSPEFLKFRKEFTDEERPSPGSPALGYRVFTHLEENPEQLGSPVGSNVDASQRMFTGVPLYSDSVNEDPTGHGFYIFPTKEMAMTYASYMLRNKAAPMYDSGEKIYISVYRVEGEYIDPNTNSSRGAYGERINFMKTIDDPLIDVEIHAGGIIKSGLTASEHESLFDVLMPIAQKRYFEQNPLALYYYYDKHTDMPKYKLHRDVGILTSPNTPKSLINYMNYCSNKDDYSFFQAHKVKKEFRQEWKQWVKDHPDWINYVGVEDYLNLK